MTDDTVYIDQFGHEMVRVSRADGLAINILKNSVEAIPKNKEGIISINEKLKNNQIIITIKDNGEGMNKEVLDKIKEPFYTTKSKGTGLGVSLSNQIIKAHEGALNYESKEKEYTKVIITLPVKNKTA